VSNELLIATHRARLPEKVNERKDGSHGTHTILIKNCCLYGMDYNNCDKDKYTHI
jgi:hypothetical protein